MVIPGDGEFFVYSMNFPSFLDIYYRYPDQFTGTLAKVGGLLALLKIASFLLSVYHRRKFENSFKPLPLPTTMDDSTLVVNYLPYKDLFTFRALKDLMSRYEDLSDV